MVTALSSLATKVEEMGRVFFFFQSTSEMVLIAYFCLCQYSNRSDFDWKQHLCPCVVLFTRCSAKHKTQLDHTQYFLRGKFSGAFNLWAVLGLIHPFPYHSLYFWELRGLRICRGPNLLLRRSGRARGDDISKAFLSCDGCVSFLLQ